MNSEEYPQPWLYADGTRIRGGELQADNALAALLSLEDGEQPVRHALLAMANWLMQAVWVGNPAPIVERMGKRMRSPQISDMVAYTGVVWSGKRRNGDDWHRGVGILLEHRREWFESDDEWAQQVAEDPGLVDQRTAAEVWYVQYGPAAEDVCRWHNADFIAIPWRDGAMSEALEPPPNF